MTTQHLAWTIHVVDLLRQKYRSPVSVDVRLLLTIGDGLKAIHMPSSGFADVAIRRSCVRTEAGGSCSKYTCPVICIHFSDKASNGNAVAQAHMTVVKRLCGDLRYAAVATSCEFRP